MATAHHSYLDSALLTRDTPLDESSFEFYETKEKTMKVTKGNHLTCTKRKNWSGTTSQTKTRPSTI